MEHIYFGRALLLSRVILAQPTLAQSNRPDASWDEAPLKASFLLAAADTGAAGDTSTSDQGKKSSEAPSETAPAGGFFGGGAAGLFGGSDTSSSLGQQSATAGYELRGSGAAAAPGGTNILTAPVRGAAVTFENGVFVYPSLFAGIGHNDNVLSQASNPVSSTLYNVVPGAIAELKTHGDRYTVSYVGNFTRYASSADDNYDHHDLFLAGDNYFTSRALLGWSVGYMNSSDPRGATDRAISTEPDMWHASVTHGLFAYGAEKATGKVELEGTYQDKRYITNRTTTVGSDVNLTTLSGRFFYRVMPKTSMVFEIRNTRADYIQSISTNDNTERRYYVGATWEATAATPGTFKLGRATKNFTDPAHQDFSGSSWEGTVRWAPLTYSTLDIITSKGTSDSTGVGAYVLNTGTTLVWNHKWATYIASKVTAGTLRSDFAGADRLDNTKTYGLGFSHELSRTLRAAADWTYTDRNSNQDTFDFKRNVLMFSIEGTL